MAVDLASLAIRIESLEVESARRRLDELRNSGQRAERSIGNLGNASSGLATKLTALAGAAVSIYTIERAFRSAMSTIDTFRVTVVGIASTLTNLAAPGQGSYGEIFARAKEQAVDMYKTINLEAARHFSSASEMMMVYNRLVQMGYNVRQDEVAALGTLTDRIKLATQGQNVEIQLNQEIRALMDGQAKATSAVAMELQARLGPQWKTLVDQHRKAGDLLQWIASLYPGLEVANKDIADTISSQWATTKSLLDLLTIGGLSGAYQDIVNLLKQANDYLREHGSTLAGDIKRGWESIRDLVTVIKGTVEGIYRIIKEPVTWAVKFVIQPGNDFTSKVMQMLDPKNFMVGGKYAPLSKTKPEVQLLRYGSESAGYEETLGGGAPIKLAPGAEKGAKGGAGAASKLESAQKQLENFIQTMDQTYAKAMGDSYAAMEEWYNKQVTTLKRLEDVVGYSKDAHVALENAKKAQLEKIDREYTQWYSKETGDRVAGVEQQMKDYLAKWGNTEERRRQITDVGERKIQDIRMGYLATMTTARQQVLSAMASATPYLDEQLDLQRQILDKENELALIEIERKRLKGEITGPMADELRMLQALTNQAKLYAEERNRWRTQGLEGGLKLAYVNAQNKARTWEAEQVASFLGSLPQDLSSSMAQGFVDTLRGRKVDLDAIADSMAASFIQKQLEGFLTQYMPMAIEGLMRLLGIEIPAKTASAEASAAILEVGGLKAGMNIYDWSVRSAQVLANATSGGGGEGGGIGGFFKSFLGLGGGGGSSPFSSGSAFWASGEPFSFQHGGIVTKPTLAIIGEAGPEKVVPLGEDRPQVNIVINNNTSAKVSTQQNPSGDIIVNIDEAMAAALNRRGKFYNALQRSPITTR